VNLLRPPQVLLATLHAQVKAPVAEVAQAAAEARLELLVYLASGNRSHR
jgi:hypothetical protein